LGGWVFDFRLELGPVTGVAEIFTMTVGEVATASLVEVAVKEPKQIVVVLYHRTVKLY
jgi:hypothetical protein